MPVVWELGGTNRKVPKFSFENERKRASSVLELERGNRRYSRGNEMAVGVTGEGGDVLLVFTRAALALAFGFRRDTERLRRNWRTRTPVADPNGGQGVIVEILLTY